MNDNTYTDKRSKVLVLGLDGGTFDVIKPLVAEGRLPHLERIMTGGAHGILQSTFPPITPTAWTSFATGKNPGRHGIFDFEQAEFGSYDFKPVPANQHGHKSVWRIVSEHGRKAIVLDVPFTYPPEPINGYMITGYGTPTTGERAFTHPVSLEEELHRVCGECKPAVVESLPNLTEGFFAEWDRILDNRDCIVRYLMNKGDWDFFMIVYGVTDNVEHVLWNFLDPLHTDYYSPRGEFFRQKLFHYYERVDQSIGEILARLDQDTYVLVMSDHGFGSVRPGFFLPHLLMEHKLLQYKGSSGLRSKLMSWILGLYHSAPALRTLVNRLPIRRGLRGAMSKANLLPDPKNIDWQHTRVFSSSFGVNLFVNRQERYPQGIVSPKEEYEALCQELKQKLLGLNELAINWPVVRQVHRREDIYNGPFVNVAPDLVVEWNNFYRPGEPTNQARVPGIVGSHTMDGIFMAQGPGILANQALDANITDLAPTILYLMGLPVPEDMDGRVLSDLFPETYVTQRPLTYGPPAYTGDVDAYGYSVSEEELVRDQLRALGYID